LRIARAWFFVRRLSDGLPCLMAFSANKLTKINQPTTEAAIWSNHTNK
jgi:hypothetical protein